MGRQRREFTPEYKGEAVKLVINTGRPVAVVAREFGVKEQTLGQWVNLFKSRQDAGDGALSETERAELVRLRRENSELKMDRAFLKNVPRPRTRSSPRLLGEWRRSTCPVSTFLDSLERFDVVFGVGEVVL